MVSHTVPLYSTNRTVHTVELLLPVLVLCADQPVYGTVPVLLQVLQGRSVALLLEVCAFGAWNILCSECVQLGELEGVSRGVGVQYQRYCNHYGVVSLAEGAQGVKERVMLSRGPTLI